MANQLEIDYGVAFNRDEHGARVLLDILEFTGVYSGTFDPESERRSSYNEGARAVGLHIISQLQLSPGALQSIIEIANPIVELPQESENETQE